jgi:hypothetical protein
MDVPVTRLADDDVRAEALKLVAEWRSLLRRNTSVARQVLTKLLGDARVTFYPTEDGYEVGASAAIEKVLASIPALRKGITIRGFEPRSPG